MIITTDLIMSWNPCDRYPHRRVQELVGDGITPLEVCDLNIPAKDKLWVLICEDVLSASTLRLLAAVWAERALMRARITDKRSWTAVCVARLHALGEATDGDLADGRAAMFAAKGDARAAARFALEPVALNAAWNTARAAAWAAVRAAGGVAGGFTVWDTAWNAARVAQLADVRRVLEESDA